MTYLNENYKNLENKYLGKFKTTPNFTSYNYNQLMTENNDESLSNIQNQSNTIPRSKLIKPDYSSEVGNSKLKNYRYFEPFEDSDNEQGVNLIEKLSSVVDINASDERNPLNI